MPQFTGEISLGAAVQIAILAIGLTRFIRHTARIEFKVNQLWTAWNGTGPTDENGWGVRLTRIEERVSALWRWATREGEPPHLKHRRGSLEQP